jgi:hypothetical protein
MKKVFDFTLTAGIVYSAVACREIVKNIFKRLFWKDHTLVQNIIVTIIRKKIKSS